MSISDFIIVMKDGVLHQMGKPQDVYDHPTNLFVAKFLGTPPINVFEGHVKKGNVYIGDDCVYRGAKTDDREVWIGIRPEGFLLKKDGALTCDLKAVEVMGRDTSIVCENKALTGQPAVRAIIPAETPLETKNGKVRFDIKPSKLYLFDKETEQVLEDIR